MDAVAPVDGVEVSKGALIGADAVLSLVVAAAPLLSAELVAPLTTALRRGIPAVGAALASVLHTFASACSRLRVQQQLLFVMIHGALTYACGDAFAQAASSPPPAAAAGTKASRPATGGMRWRPLRTVRAAVAGLAADAIPFYYWGALLQTLHEMRWVQWLMRAARVPERALPTALLSLKIGLHTVIFQPLTTAGLMLIQALLRRDSWAEACGLVRRRFATAFLVAASTFAVGGLLVYSLSSVALQSALRNMGVLGYAVYMALLSNS